MAYVAIIRKEPGSDYGIDFPDLPGCVTAGKTLAEARRFAAEALTLHLDGLAAGGLPIPPQRPVETIRAEPEYRTGRLILIDAV
jgi:predicted RNase H-like HicB family nuclease